MFRTLAFVAVLVLTATALAEGPEKKKDPWAEHRGKVWFEMGYEKGMEAVKDTGKPPMLFFAEKACAVCKKVAKESFTDPATLEVLEAFTPILVDVAVEKAVANKYKVTTSPAVVFANADGTPVETVRGQKSVEEFRSVATKAKASAERGVPSKGYVRFVETYNEMEKAFAEDDVKTTIAAILTIERTARSGPLVARTAQVKKDVVDSGFEKIAEAKEMAAHDQMRGIKLIRVVHANWQGTAPATEARTLLRSLLARSGDRR